jgi:hypothetical protein
MCVSKFACIHNAYVNCDADIQRGIAGCASLDQGSSTDIRTYIRVYADCKADARRSVTR